MKNSMTHLLRLELRKFNPKRNIIVTGLLILFCLLFLTVSMVDSMTDPDQTKDSFASMFQMTSILLPFLFLVYAAVLTATFVIGEYNTRTITILFACPLNKKQLIAAKLIIIAGFTAAAMVAGYLLCCGYLIGADAAFDMLEDSFQPALLPRFASAAGSSILACVILSLWSFIAGMSKKSVPATIISVLVVFFLRQVMLSKDSLIQESIGQIAVAALITAIAMYVVFRKKVTAID